jgi:hypothetical protein
VRDSATKKPAKPARAAGIIAAIWVVSFLIGLGIPCFLLIRHAIESDVFSGAIDEISGIYAPHVGAILAYYLAARALRRRETTTPLLAFTLAAIVSVAWNLIAVGILARVVTGSAGLEDAAKLAGEISRKLAWVVAPVMGYFFASDAKAASRP